MVINPNCFSSLELKLDRIVFKKTFCQSSALNEKIRQVPFQSRFQLYFSTCSATSFFICFQGQKQYHRFGLFSCFLRHNKWCFNNTNFFWVQKLKKLDYLDSNWVLEFQNLVLVILIPF